MHGKLVDLSLSLSGKQRLTLELDSDFREEYDRLKDVPVDVSVKKHRKRRSLDANAYFWVLCGKLAAYQRIPPKEVYQHYIPDVGDNYEIVPVREDHLEHWDKVWCSGHDGRLTVDMGPCKKLPGYHNVRSYIGSSDYDIAQMSRLIDMIVSDCKERGIETLTPDQLARLEGYDAQYYAG